MGHNYERGASLALSEVLPHIQLNEGKKAVKEFNGLTVSLGKRKLRVFATKGTTCPKCGLKASFIAIERHKGSAMRWHLNVYALREETGEEVQFTIDHILPKARGGSNAMYNLQPMCEPCNTAKSDSLDIGGWGIEEWNSSTQKNLTKLTVSSRVCVRRKTYSYADSSNTTKT